MAHTWQSTFSKEKVHSEKRATNEKNACLLDFLLNSHLLQNSKKAPKTFFKNCLPFCTYVILSSERLEIISLIHYAQTEITGLQNNFTPVYFPNHFSLTSVENEVQGRCVEENS